MTKTQDTSQSALERGRRIHSQMSRLGWARKEAKERLGKDGWADIDPESDPATMCRVGFRSNIPVGFGKVHVSLRVAGSGHDWTEAFREAERAKK